jgi:23S rRNA pseudouridine955/2504/2580 synthase
MFLHASIAVVKHPATGENLRIEAPLANDMKKFLNELDTKNLAP